MKIDNKTMRSIQFKVGEPGGLARSDSGLERPASGTERHVLDERIFRRSGLN